MSEDNLRGKLLHLCANRSIEAEVDGQRRRVVFVNDVMDAVSANMLIQLEGPEPEREQYR